MSDKTAKGGEFWSRVTQKLRDGNEANRCFWWQIKKIQERLNKKVSGGPGIGYIQHSLSNFKGILPLENVLSLGCGSGILERDLFRLAGFRRCDAFDAAKGSIEEAVKLAHDENVTGVSYSVADVNGIELQPGKYDAVWVNGAMHHFMNLEHVCHQIRRSLKPGGYLILNEYVGPSKFQISRRQKDVAAAAFKLLPAHLRIPIGTHTRLFSESLPFHRGLSRFSKKAIVALRSGRLPIAVANRIRRLKSKTRNEPYYVSTLCFPSVHEVEFVDPTEAVRSDEIVDVVKSHFDIVERRDLGGNILFWVLNGFAGNYPDGEVDSDRYLDALIAVEDAFLGNHEAESDFAYFVCRPKAS